VTAATPISVLCADDNALVCDALRTGLAGAPGEFRWLGHLASADALVQQVDLLRPDVVILDIDMPGRDPFAALADLAAHAPGTRVVMYTGHVSRDLINRALDTGAWGYLSKHASITEILAALRRVAQGHIVLSPDAAQACAPASSEAT
jgi:DNA-binding NarL/FixJ family response regulator